MLEMLGNGMVVVILQYISILNQQIVHLKLTQYCISQSSGGGGSIKKKKDDL